jgi:hypothetical protein
MPEQELLGVDQDPAEVFDRLPEVGGPGASISSCWIEGIMK